MNNILDKSSRKKSEGYIFRTSASEVNHFAMQKNIRDKTGLENQQNPNLLNWNNEGPAGATALKHLKQLKLASKRNQRSKSEANVNKFFVLNSDTNRHIPNFLQMKEKEVCSYMSKGLIPHNKVKEVKASYVIFITKNSNKKGEESGTKCP